MDDVAVFSTGMMQCFECNKIPTFGRDQVKISKNWRKIETKKFLKKITPLYNLGARDSLSDEDKQTFSFLTNGDNSDHQLVDS